MTTSEIRLCVFLFCVGLAIGAAAEWGGAIGIFILFMALALATLVMEIDSRHGRKPD